MMGAATLVVLPSAASATIGDTMNTSVTGGYVDVTTSIYGTLKSGSYTTYAEIGQITLFGQSSTKLTGTLTSLPVWCIDITDNLSSGKFVEKPLSWATAGAMGAGADVLYSTAQLNNVLKYLVYTKDKITDATSSAATQLGIWEILNETSASPSSTPLGSGTFTTTQWYSSSATNLANTWLTSSAFASTSTNNYSLAILDDTSKTNQLLAYLRYTAPVPEPASWMTMILGFGAMGWAMRRRRAVGRAVA